MSASDTSFLRAELTEEEKDALSKKETVRLFLHNPETVLSARAAREKALDDLVERQDTHSEVTYGISKEGRYLALMLPRNSTEQEITNRYRPGTTVQRHRYDPEKNGLVVKDYFVR